MSISFLTRPTGSGDAEVVGRVWEALRTVRDPELDADVVSLDFVAAVDVDVEHVAHVSLRLPTYFCAPNFAFLMVADAWDAVSTVEGLSDVEVVLIDHFASDAIKYLLELAHRWRSHNLGSLAIMETRTPWSAVEGDGHHIFLDSRLFWVSNMGSKQIKHWISSAEHGADN